MSGSPLLTQTETKKPPERAAYSKFLVEPMGIEPTTSALRTLRSPN